MVNIVMLKLKLLQKIMLLQKKKNWCVLMVDKALKPQVIGTYLHSFIIEMLTHQNIADIIVGINMLLSHQEKLCLQSNGEWEVK
jgi:hypothetical protein